MDHEKRDAKSLNKLAIEGGENSCYFHALLKRKGREYSVNSLICDGVWTDDQTVIKDVIYNHFCNRFKEPHVDRPKFRSSLFRRIHESDALLLESSISMDELKQAACRRGIFAGLSLANDGANLLLLQYAYDTLLFGKWSRLNVKHLVKILGWFQNASGLKVNPSKSILYGIRVELCEVINVASSISCSHDSLPFSYLGIPVGKIRAPSNVLKMLEAKKEEILLGFKG
ncbi:hypothetical protein CTI12_AA614140 [Artemisia annua]|uniref:RNA-directed DNA polymerase, eukaryota, Reverse transcriptase zinc-binding domain protein n=1 Tax=Artemisia annua TaxID=35608 RepID=A0A2U1KE09_ARTAN|nr:hypothetical protein CTI12_AA614140 [Artemisia annua]